ncbi:MAG TPA: site-specific integrase [Kofleriaceae bacterium]|nr:site-specific integrase [Kofleriaceae bacterium]
MSAYKDPRDGRWRYRTRVVLPNGKRERIGGTPAIDTKAAAEHAERLHILRVTEPGHVLVNSAPVETQVPVAPAAAERKELPTFREFAVRFMNEYLPRQKPGERATKQSILNSSLLPFFGELRLDEIDQSHVNAYIATQTVATKTVNNRLAVLSTLMKYAGTRGCKLIPEPQLICHIDSMEAEIIAVPIDDVRKMIQAATDDRYAAAVLLAAEAGLRVGEIRGLQWTDLRDGRITIRRSVDVKNNIGAPKHNKSRTVRLSPALETALAKLPRRGLWVVSKLDGGLLGYWTMLEAVRKLYERAGVVIPVSETGETMPWHSLRHTFGTECAARGVPLPTIKELMGHVDVKTTMRYVTVTDAQKDAAIERAFGAVSPTTGQLVANNSASVS